MREAAARGARVVLMPELFRATPTSAASSARRTSTARTRSPATRPSPTSARCRPSSGSPCRSRSSRRTARTSTQRRDDRRRGQLLGVYRKSHIPDGPGYQEKFFFRPGDTGFRAFGHREAALGVAICWDQWFPEAARAMVLAGADVLFYPTAIGSEPPEPGLNSSRHWQRTMQGHAAANIVPLIASNRIGTEGADDDPFRVTFYGTSFAADHTGAVVAEADRTTSGVITATFDLDEVGEYRTRWGLFRDRRPDLYGALATLDGG